MPPRHPYLHFDPFVLFDVIESDLAAYRSLSATFCTIAPTLLLRLDQAMRSLDALQISQACHAFKGSTSLAGARRLTERLHAIDMIAQAHGSLDVALVIGELTQMLEALLLEVRHSMVHFAATADGSKACAPNTR